MASFPTITSLLHEAKIVKSEMERMKKLGAEGVFDDEWTFVHHSDINKLGIYPESSFNTPIAIYSYPADTYTNQDLTGVWYDWESVPFASERKYFHVFSVKQEARSKLLIIDHKGKLRPASILTVQQIHEKLKKLYNQHFPDAFEASFELSNAYTHARAADDPHTNTEEMSDADLQRLKALAIRKAQDPEFEEKPWMQELLKIIDSDAWFDSGDENQIRTKLEVKHVWNAMRLLALERGDGSREWSKILVGMGIHGIVDHGSGTLHSSERDAAAFFYKSELERIASFGGTEEDKGRRLHSVQKKVNFVWDETKKQSGTGIQLMRKMMQSTSSHKAVLKALFVYLKSETPSEANYQRFVALSFEAADAVGKAALGGYHNFYVMQLKALAVVADYLDEKPAHMWTLRHARLAIGYLIKVGKKAVVGFQEQEREALFDLIERWHNSGSLHLDALFDYQAGSKVSPSRALMLVQDILQ